MRQTRENSFFASFILALLGLAVLPAQAQIPETFENLQVFPKDIDRGELIREMRNMTGALGFRCHHCHVGEPGGSLEGYDFASDRKETKKKARIMLEMVERINSELLPKIGKKPSDLTKVSCVTCHSGQARPQTLKAALKEVYDQEGIEATIARYRELRERYYGRGTYDFSEWRLLNLAEALADREKLEDAHRLVLLNLEHYPDFGMNYIGVGKYHQDRGEKKEAIAAYEKAKELQPKMAPRIQAMIDQLNEP